MMTSSFPMPSSEANGRSTIDFKRVIRQGVTSHSNNITDLDGRRSHTAALEMDTEGLRNNNIHAFHEKINRHLDELKKHGHRTQLGPVKTAILDTGYDCNYRSDSERSKRSSIQEAEDDESIMRSMARRKRSAPKAELEPKRCREPGCDKTFKRPCDLTKHEKTHSRPWKCPVQSCKYHVYGWPTEKEWDRHYTDKHSANPPLYECHFKPCPYRSKRESNCKIHMEKAHAWAYVTSRNRGENSEKGAATLSKRGDGPVLSALQQPNYALNNDQEMSPRKDPEELQAETISNWRPLQFSGDSRSTGFKRLDKINKPAPFPIPQATKTSGDRPYRDRPPKENRRKVLPVLIKKRQYLACPDSGSTKNIMSESFAKECNLKIRRGPKDMKLFELGSGKYISSIGRVSVPVQLLGHLLERKKRWFYVFATCPVPLILGMPFLDEAEIFTRNRHLLETCPLELGRISCLLWIGSSRKDSHDSPRNRFMCSLDGHRVEAVADTGSDLNMMSLHFAKREGFQIDRRREARIRIQVGNATETETIGQVQVHNFSLDWRKPPTLENTPQMHNAPQNNKKTDEEDNDGIIFHVLPGLPCDVIFGRELLEEADIFNLCFNSGQNLSRPLTPKRDAFELHVLINLGPVAILLPIPRRRRRKCALNAVDQKEAHDDSRHAEIFRRTTREEEIAGLPVEQQFVARNIEERRIAAWNTLHRTCKYCQLT